MSENDRLHVERVLREIDQPEDRHVHYELADIFERAAAASQQRGDEQRARQLKWELEAWRLVPTHAWEPEVTGANFKPMVTFSDGSLWPDLAAFSEEQAQYLRGRAEATRNPAIRALYQEILWDRTKDPAAGRTAAAAYAEFAGSRTDEEASIDLMHALTRPLTLALQLNDAALLVKRGSSFAIGLLDSVTDTRPYACLSWRTPSSCERPVLNSRTWNTRQT